MVYNKRILIIKTKAKGIIEMDKEASKKIGRVERIIDSNENMGFRRSKEDNKEIIEIYNNFNKNDKYEIIDIYKNKREFMEGENPEESNIAHDNILHTTTLNLTRKRTASISAYEGGLMIISYKNKNGIGYDEYCVPGEESVFYTTKGPFTQEKVSSKQISKKYNTEKIAGLLLDKMESEIEENHMDIN